MKKKILKVFTFVFCGILIYGQQSEGAAAGAGETEGNSQRRKRSRTSEILPGAKRLRPDDTADSRQSPDFNDIIFRNPTFYRIQSQQNNILDCLRGELRTDPDESYVSGVSGYEEYYRYEHKKGDDEVDIDGIVFLNKNDLPSNSRVALTLVSKEVPGAWREETRPNHTIHSLFRVRALDTDYIIFFGGQSEVKKDIIDPVFGNHISRRVHIQTKRREDRTLVFKSMKESHTYHKGADLSYDNTVEPSIDDGKNLEVSERELNRHIGLKQEEPLKLSYRENHITIHAPIPLLCFPQICVDLNKIYRRRALPRPFSNEAVLVMEQKQKDKLDELMFDIMSPASRSKKGVYFLRAFIENEPDDFDSYRVFNNTMDSRKNTSDIFNQSFSSLEDALRYCVAHLTDILCVVDPTLGEEEREVEHATPLKNIKKFKKIIIRGFKDERYVPSKGIFYLHQYLSSRIYAKLEGNRKHQYYFYENKNWYTYLPNDRVVDHYFGERGEFRKPEYLIDYGDLHARLLDNPPKKKIEPEGNFNFRAAREVNELVLSDRLLIPFVEEEGKIPWGTPERSFEAFDLIDVERQRLIAVKKGGGQDLVSHFVWQTLNAANLLRYQWFREWTKHYLTICHFLIDANGISEANQFFGRGGDQSSSALQGHAYQIIKTVYGEEREIETEEFMRRLKEEVLPHAKKIIQGREYNPEGEDPKKLQQALNKVAEFFDNFDPHSVTVVLGVMVKDRPTDISKDMGKSLGVKYTIINLYHELTNLGYKFGLWFIPSQRV